MTFKEKLTLERPECVNDYKYAGGCRGCPYIYGYAKETELTCIGGCERCWNKEFNDNDDNHILNKN